MWAAMFTGLNPILARSHTRHSCFLGERQKADISSAVFTADWLDLPGSSDCADFGDIGKVDSGTRAAHHPDFHLSNMIWESTHNHFQSLLHKWLNRHWAASLFLSSHLLNSASKTNLPFRSLWPPLSWTATTPSSNYKRQLFFFFSCCSLMHSGWPNNMARVMFSFGTRQSSEAPWRIAAWKQSMPLQESGTKESNFHLHVQNMADQKKRNVRQRRTNLY